MDIRQGLLCLRRATSGLYGKDSNTWVSGVSLSDHVPCVKASEKVFYDTLAVYCRCSPTLLSPQIFEPTVKDYIPQYIMQLDCNNKNGFWPLDIDTGEHAEPVYCLIMWPQNENLKK